MIIAKIPALGYNKHFDCIIVFFLNGRIRVEMCVMEIIDQLAERYGIRQCLESIHALLYRYRIVTFGNLLQCIDGRVVDVCGIYNDVISRIGFGEIQSSVYFLQLIPM